MSIFSGILSGGIKDVEKKFAPEFATIVKYEPVLAGIASKIDENQLAAFISQASGGKITTAEAFAAEEAIRAIVTALATIGAKISAV